MDAHVRFLPSDRRVRVAAGRTLHDAVRRAGLPIASACGADGVCGRCDVIVIAGGGHLPPETPAERALKERNRVPPERRLACRVVLERGELDVTTSYW